MTVYRKTGHNAAPFEKKNLHCRRPDIELSKFYRHSLCRSHYNRPNRSFPSAWNNTFLRNRSIFSRYLRTPRCARFSCRGSQIQNYVLTSVLLGSGSLIFRNSDCLNYSLTSATKKMAKCTSGKGFSMPQ